VISVLDMAESGDPGAGGGDRAGPPSTTEKPQPATDLAGGDAAGRRRRVVVAGHRGDAPTSAAATGDPDPSVRASALGALARAGSLTVDELRGALSDVDLGVRRRGAEESGRALARGALEAHDVVPLLLDALGDPEPTVVESAVWAIGEAGGAAASAVDRLARLALGGPDLCREAAVAALGAIGDLRGLPAVLAATEDRPAVRRRAAVALAAFDDPRAEEGLRRAAGDRDWQVRQVAEDLLDER
jgi:HEAT repeat protein